MLGEDGQDWEPREAGAGLASHSARLSLCSLLWPSWPRLSLVRMLDLATFLSPTWSELK